MPPASISPAIILVRPQLGMNIGMVARAMANFGLADLRLVAPRDGWPNPDAGPAAAGADAVLEGAQLFDSVADALHDCRAAYATTVRPREFTKPVLAPRAAAAAIRESASLKAGILFGPERSGLTADDLAGIGTIITCPVSKGFGSLNLAQAVLLVAYEWFQAEAMPPASPDRAPAPHSEVNGMLEQLIASLEAAGHFHVPDKAPATKRTLAHMLTRPAFTSEEVRTLRGIIRALTEARRPRAL